MTDWPHSAREAWAEREFGQATLDVEFGEIGQRAGGLRIFYGPDAGSKAARDRTAAERKQEAERQAQLDQQPDVLHERLLEAERHLRIELRARGEAGGE